MMLVITTLYYARTFFPCLILLLAVCWSLLFRLLPKCYGPAVAGALIGLGVVFLARYLHIYQGYAANREVVDRNLQAIEAARTEGELTMSVDLEADYRFTMFFEGHYFLSNFLRYYGLPQDIPLRFTSEEWDVSNLQVGDAVSTFPTLEKDGELLVPMEFLFQESGHPCVFYWTDLHFELSYGGSDYALYSDGSLLRHLPDGGVEPVGYCVPRMPHSYTYTLLYLSAQDLERCFGITLSYDAAGMQRMCLNGEDVTELIRTQEVSMAASTVSAYPAVRAFLLEMQRELARRHSVIMDGRDIGTVVLPGADVKIFLTAGSEIRARRRWLELRERGTPRDWEQLLQETRERDERDANRAESPLRPAADSVLLDTSELDFSQSLERIIEIIRERTGS